MLPTLKLPSRMLQDQIVDWFQDLRRRQDTLLEQAEKEDVKDADTLLYPYLQEVREKSVDAYRKIIGVLAVQYVEYTIGILGEEVLDLDSDTEIELEAIFPDYEEFLDEKEDQEEDSMYGEEDLELEEEMNETDAQLFYRLKEEMTLSELEDLLDERPDLLVFFMDCAIEKSYDSMYEQESFYELAEQKGFLGMYARLNPYYEMDMLFRKINNLKESGNRLENEISDYYLARMSSGMEQSSVIQDLIQTIKTTYQEEEQDQILKRLVQCYYYYTKGQALLNSELVDDFDLKILEIIEQKPNAFPIETLKEKDIILERIVDRYCYYQDHLTDENNVEIHRIEQQKNYMKKLDHFSIRKGDNQNGKRV